MVNTRIKDLTNDTTPSASDYVAIDADVGGTRNTNLTDLVNAARPFASEAEAVAGTSTTTGMNPLATKQAIEAIGDGRFASVAQGALADTALQPSDIGTTVQARDALLDSVSDLSLTAGDLIKATGADAVSRLPIGAEGQVLAVVGGDLAYKSVPAVDLPEPAVANTVPVRKSDNSAYEAKTFAELAGEIGEFPTRAAAVASSLSIAPDYIRTAGYTSAGDGGGALYKEVASEPSHAGKFSITLSDGVTVVWYEIAEDEVRPEMVGAFPGAATSQHAEFEDMFAIGSPRIYIPRGVWRLDADVAPAARDMHITLDGTLDFSNANGQLKIWGSLTALSAMSATMTKHSKTIQFGSDQGVAPGDVIILHNPTDFSYGGRRAEYRDGGMFMCHSLSGNNVLTYEMAVDAYNSASMNVYKLNGFRVTVEGDGFVIPAVSSEKAPIDISLMRDVTIRGVKNVAGGEYGGVSVDRCYNVKFDMVTGENNSPHVNNEYSLIISASQHVSVDGAFGAATRHAVTIGSYNREASPPCRYVNISGMSLHNHPANQTGAGDIHGNGDFVTYDNCIMAGFSGGGRNVRVHGCTIFGMPEAASGMCVTMPEINGGYIEFDDCNFISEGDGVSNGYLHIQAIGSGGYGYPAGTNLREDTTVRVSNCRLDTPNAGTLAKAVMIEGANANKKVNVVIDGLQWQAPQGLAFLFAREIVKAQLDTDFLIVDNVYGPSGAYLIHPQATISAALRKEMAQSGSVVTSCASGSSVATSGAVSFRHPYSKVPTVFGSGQTSSTGATKATWGTKRVNTFPVTLTATQITMTTQTSDGTNFSSTEDVRQHWTVGVAEI